MDSTMEWFSMAFADVAAKAKEALEAKAIKIKQTPKSAEDNSRIVHQGGEAPSFGPVRKPKD